MIIKSPVTTFFGSICTITMVIMALTVTFAITFPGNQNSPRTFVKDFRQNQKPISAMRHQRESRHSFPLISRSRSL